MKVQAKMKELLAEPIILIENSKPVGLRNTDDYAAWSKAVPKLIYCSITGFGQTGPCAVRGL